MLIKIPVRNKAEAAFWVRSFELEKEVTQVTGMIIEKDQRKLAFAPMIIEHQAGSYFWVVFLGLNIDALGLQQGMGFVWLTTTPEHTQEALKARDELADFVLAEASAKGKFDEIIEVENKKDV